MTEKENKISFVPKEKGSLPRILLIDFEEKYHQLLEDTGYQVYSGFSGFGENPLSFPKDKSEIEIILWDTSNFRTDNNITLKGGECSINDYRFGGNETYDRIIKILTEYCERMRKKGGFVGVFLGDNIPKPVERLDEILNRRFSFKNRYTTTLSLKKHKEENVWFDFYKKFIQEKNIHFLISWLDNLVDFNRYFEDEDENIHAVAYDYFAIIPKIETARKKEALSYLMQDVLPHCCNGDVFPDKYYYLWANKNIYLPPSIQKLKNEKYELVKNFQKETERIDKSITNELKKAEHLSTMLIADDSNLFKEGEKLSDCVHKVLKIDIGFSVTDVDKMKLKIGESLKEDKWIEDNGFFALVEIKGTEKGAKANWVRVDLNAHIREFEVVKKVKDLKSVLVFNHERRTEPESRSNPFTDDPSLITYCEETKICLLPVYELFKLASAIREKNVTQERAREVIKQCVGLFSFDKV